MRYYDNIPEEQESIIDLNYFTKTLDIYTTRKVQMVKLTKELGAPDRTYAINGKICSCEWKIPFQDTKRTAKALSRPILIGSLNHSNLQENSKEIYSKILR